MTSDLRLQHLAKSLGGSVTGQTVIFPGPGHSLTDRSAWLKISPQAPDGILCGTFSSRDTWQDVKDYVRAKLGMRIVSTSRELPLISHTREEPADNANVARAMSIWREGVDVLGSLAERYLNSRRLTLSIADDWFRVLRFHPSYPFGTERAPAMIALMRDFRTDEPRCIQRTRLTADGKKIGRMMLGPSKGAAIKIDEDADVTMGICLGEGLETCLSALFMDNPIRPVWALGSANATACFPVLPGIEEIHILMEHDKSGANQRAADECGARWIRGGREVFTVSPVVGNDLNDELRAG